MKRLHTSAPGRICLFGEHQDYLGLPVIAMAVDLRFHIEFEPEAGRTFRIETPDLPGSEAEELDIHADAPRSDDDFCWGIGQVLLESGFRFETGGRVIFRSGIPIRAGCSSSSAMSAAWMRMLLELGAHDQKQILYDRPELAAYLVYRGEKEKFAGAGGMMDQYSCYLGGLIHVYPETQGSSNDPAPTGDLTRLADSIPYGVERLPNASEGFVLIDSGVPKDTQGVLSTAGNRARDAIAAMERELTDFHLDRTELPEFDAAVSRAEGRLTPDQKRIARDHLINRDLCRRGLTMLRETVDETEMGTMLNEEHRVLSATLGISTPRIDALQQTSLRAGARGAKINGSGGGGTLFCYAPGEVEAVSRALEQAEVRYFPVHAAPGARVDEL